MPTLLRVLVREILFTLLREAVVFNTRNSFEASAYNVAVSVRT